jgi:hypothetical protein
VYVFDHVAEKMAREHRHQVLARLAGAGWLYAGKHQLLAHAVAHEIGHVLLQQDAHSPTGLMRALWDRNDLQAMMAGQLGFTREESERVRAELLRRGDQREDQSRDRKGAVTSARRASAHPEQDRIASC